MIPDFEKYFLEMEILALLVAAFFIGLGHSGFDNHFNSSASIPLEIIFSNQPINETNHLGIAVHINEKVGIFSNLSETDKVKI
jgi:hypothetical protein